jgi:hypothetical protein
MSYIDVSAKTVKILGLNPNLPCKLARPGTIPYSSSHLIYCKWYKPVS